jgi:hypothetical protein
MKLCGSVLCVLLLAIVRPLVGARGSTRRGEKGDPIAPLGCAVA